MIFWGVADAGLEQMIAVGKPSNPNAFSMILGVLISPIAHHCDGGRYEWENQVILMVFYRFPNSVFWGLGSNPIENHCSGKT